MLKGLTWEESMELLNSWKKSILDNNVYGYGLSSMMNYMAPAYRWRDSSFTFKGIVDQNSTLHGQTIMRFPVISLDDLPIHKDTKIVVIADDYKNISEKLKYIGLKENKNFIDIHTYFTLWGGVRHDKLICEQIYAVLLTDRCTLKCEHCGVKVPYLRTTEGDRDIKKIEADLDLFFSRVDWVATLGLSGGDALLYKQMPALLTLIGQKYRGKCSHVDIASNGMIIPDENILSLAAEHNMRFVITDYSNATGIGDTYKIKLKNLQRALDAYGIDKAVICPEWFIYYLEQDEAAQLLASTASEEMKKRFRNCPINSMCALLVDGVYYPCGRSYHLTKLGVMSASDAVRDGINFNTIDPKNKDDRTKLLATFLGYHSEPLLKACENCPEFFPENKVWVPRGNQLGA